MCMSCYAILCYLGALSYPTWYLIFVACIDMSHGPRGSKIRFPRAVKISFGADALRTRKPICKIVFFFVCKYLHKNSKIAHNFVLQNHGFLLKKCENSGKNECARAMYKQGNTLKINFRARQMTTSQLAKRTGSAIKRLLRANRK